MNDYTVFVLINYVMRNKIALFTGKPSKYDDCQGLLYPITKNWPINTFEVCCFP